MERRHSRKYLERSLNRKKLSGRGDWPPQRCGAGLGGIPVPQQQVQLMRIEPDAALSVRLRPVLEAALRESLLAEPETLAVVGQNFDRVTTPRTENKQR